MIRDFCISILVDHTLTITSEYSSVGIGLKERLATHPLRSSVH